MEAIKSFIKRIVEIPTVSGYEKINAPKVLSACTEYAGDVFTEARITSSGSIVLEKKCGKKNAKRLCFDAHLDTIGFAVSEICERGFVRLAPLGGIDANILPSSEIVIHGKQDIRAVFTSIPPHLSRSDNLPEVGELLCDTGLDDERLRELINVGTPCTFYPAFVSLLNNRICCPGLDDKCCIAAIMQSAVLLQNIQLENTDVIFYLSSGEERGGKGSHRMWEEIHPDACIVLDVNFAKEKQSIEGEYGKLGEGAMVSVSSVVNMEMTELVRKSATDNRLKLQTVCEMTSTGTNADVCARTGFGIAVAVLSIPLKYMHSFTECISLDDVLQAAQILSKTAELYDKSPVGKPIYYKGGAAGEL